ncbi:MAG TPA: hypothetical protein VMW09_07080 [Desulfatiglandales bacterium]|nr:hypothetical protein [Desulfatiglandales bacterium]
MTWLFKKDIWNNLEKLLKFDKANAVDSTFFVAVDNGKGLNYALRQARKAIDLVKEYEFDVGVHGICYDNYDGIKEEYKMFKRISGLEKFAIR